MESSAPDILQWVSGGGLGAVIVGASAWYLNMRKQNQSESQDAQGHASDILKQAREYSESIQRALNEENAKLRERVAVLEERLNEKNQEMLELMRDIASNKK